MKLKYRTNQTEIPLTPTVFSTKTMTYKLDEVTGDLVEAGEVDDYEIIQSNSDCALSEMLARFGYDAVAQMSASAPQKYVEVEEDPSDRMFSESDRFVRSQKDMFTEQFVQKYGAEESYKKLYEKVVAQATAEIEKQYKEALKNEKDQGQGQSQVVPQHGNPDAPPQS